jgi:hypothetical protein
MTAGPVPSPPRTAPPEPRRRRGADEAANDLLARWIATQSVNLDRHATALRPFTYSEFGTGAAAPSRAHIDAVNQFIGRFRARLADVSGWVSAAAAQAKKHPTDANLALLLARKESASVKVLHVEGIWDFYFDLFVQRLSALGERLRAVDRIAANCYEDLYLGIGTAKPAPTLLPFTYAASGFSPFTYRRGVPLRRLRHHPNLFPLVVIPQHRLNNVWALSSVLHEVSHNLQADLGLWDIMPKLIAERLTRDGRLPVDVAEVWARWHKEITADMFAVLLGGPAAVESLMDVVGRSRPSTVRFSAMGVHPTPVLRVPISVELLRRLGFREAAEAFTIAWRRLYPRVTTTDVPPAVLHTFRRAAELTVDTIVFTSHPKLAGKPLAKLVEFGPSQMAMIDLAATRLAEGADVGAVPPRLMVGAARQALDRRLASPETITENFYRALGRR